MYSISQALRTALFFSEGGILKMMEDGVKSKALREDDWKS
jgi:hypothetical protein